MFKEKNLLKKAKNKLKTIVYPEAGFSDRVIEAAKIIVKKKIAKVVLIGDESALVMRYKHLKNMIIINPKTSSLKDELGNKLFELRKAKGMTEDLAKKTIQDPFYFATMLVREGYADGMIGGVEVSTSRNIKPALQLIKAKSEDEIVTSCFIMFGKNKITNNSPIIFGDCGLVEFPNSAELSIIAEHNNDIASKIVGIKPKVAFLSYSTNGSATGENIDKMKEATKIFKAKNKMIACEGEVQFDTAVSTRVAKIKYPNSTLAKSPANVLVFPDINSGNICYKAVQNFGKMKAIGPILVGLKKPVNDLSRGCTIKDIVTMTAVTVLQCD